MLVILKLWKCNKVHPGAELFESLYKRQNTEPNLPKQQDQMRNCHEQRNIAYRGRVNGETLYKTSESCYDDDYYFNDFDKFKGRRNERFAFHVQTGWCEPCKGIMQRLTLNDILGEASLLRLLRG